MSRLTPQERELTKTGARRVGLKVFMCTFVGALVIVIIGVSTNSPAIAVGVFGGVVAATFTFVVSFKARAALRRDLGKSNQHRNRLN